MKKSSTPEWLNLNKAAELLGVHPGTVRNWSNQGLLSVYRTRGGHRRYLQSEVELWMKSQQANGSHEMDQVIQSALRNTRLQISAGRLEAEQWYSKLDEGTRIQFNQSGRKMLQGLIGSLSIADEAACDEAHNLGIEYATRSRRSGLNLAEAAQAFFFFRTLLSESMFSVFEAAAVRSPAAWSRMFRRINNFTDCMLAALIESYAAYLSAP